MCGIFGILGNDLPVDTNRLRKEINSLFVLSESRGKEAAGIAVSYKDEIRVLKGAMQASKMITTEQYRKVFLESFKFENRINSKFKIIGHSRLVTNGSEENNTNNQPVIKDGYITIHNGIITNVGNLYRDNTDLIREFEVDTEIIPSLTSKYEKSGIGIIESIKKVFKNIEGSASLCMLSSDYDDALLVTNNGSLYAAFTPDRNNLVFTSERYILKSFIKKSKLFSEADIIQVESFNGFYFGGNKDDHVFFNLNEEASNIKQRKSYKRIIIDIPDNNCGNKTRSAPGIILNNSKLLEDNSAEIKYLKRCKKCLLTETFPFIEFDSEGICNYCNNYKPKFASSLSERQKGESEILRISETYKKQNGYDVLVPFSGGRDSSYGLSYIKRELGLNPVTFTYDWGMITDLARRNISRICGKLGIENILVSADIRKKRKNINDNVTAWLKKPVLGIIPLFMAGDKQFFYYVNLLKKQNDIEMNIWMTNPLENTDFKSGFAGIKPNFDKERIYDLTLKDKMNMIGFYLKSFLNNPDYLNSSLPDTMGAYFSYYIEPRKDYYHLFNYLYWDEDEIEQYLIREFNWELSTDTKSSWRIGDGTAAFYNYIYYTVCGFSEYDTFRSNQIREGMISRDEALKKIYSENMPREMSLRWYCMTIGIDFDDTIKSINGIQKLYRKLK
jgi:glutamine---fructose-6-phosphate transaminase (isomerizing)